MKRHFQKLVLLFSLTATSHAFSTTTVDVFQRHPNPVFVETGSFVGDGIYMAIQAGFSEIYSIELAPHHHESCKKRFEEFPNVHLFLGDSGIVLKEVLSHVKQRATFWLDGHYSAGINSGLGETQNPILKELEIIASHPIKNHTILIDDIRMFGTADFDHIEIKTLISMLKKINPNYRIYFEDGYIKNDVLVAEVD